jgi:hypothetical protein
MPTSKTIKKIKRSEKAAKKAANGGAKMITEVAHRGARLGQNATALAIPAAAVLGTGALAAAGFVMREELAELMHTAVETFTMTSRVGSKKLLGLAGLQRRPSLFAMVLPEIGGFAAGLASGAVLTMLLAPKSKRAVESAEHFVENGAASGLKNASSMHTAAIGSSPVVHPVP